MNGTTQYKLKQKITSLKRALLQLNHQNYRHIQERAKQAQLHLDKMQQKGLSQGYMDEGYQEQGKKQIYWHRLNTSSIYNELSTRISGMLIGTLPSFIL